MVPVRFPETVFHRDFLSGPQGKAHVDPTGRYSARASVQGPLDVAEHRVHPPQARRLAAARSPSGYPRAVLTTCFLHSPEAGQSVRVDHRLPPQMPVGPGRNLLLAEPFHAAHPQRHRPAFFGDLHGRHQRRLALRPSSAFASSGFAPQVGIVHLHDVAQPAALVPFLHHLHQLCFSDQAVL